MKNYLMLGVACFILTVVAGCNTTGTPVEYAKACSTENDKKVVEVSAFLDDKGGVFCSNTGGGPVRCGFRMKAAPESEKVSISADIERGDGANEVEELKSGYKREDIKIRANDGSLVNLSEKVKVTGTMNFVPGSERCYLTVAKIEK